MNNLLPRRAPLQAIDLDSEIHDALREIKRPVILPAPPMQAEDVGRLSAQAVMAQYEYAAKCVEELGAEVKDRVQKLEAQLKEADIDLKLIGDAATKIREKGKLIHTQIEEASQLSQDIRETCAEFVRKVGA